MTQTVDPAQTEQAPVDCMQVAPQKEHAWLERMVGEWEFEHEAVMGPDQPTMKTKGTERVYSLGGLWVIGESTCQMPDGDNSEMRITLGYDPLKQKFVGSWYGTMMTSFWVYEGTLDADERVLTLEADGPAFNDPTATAKYRDIVTLVSDDHRMLTSQVQGEDGVWQQFMEGHYRRTK
ncbi:MAG: DUF1579 domain-containing protein [Chloroflexota bacterium]